MSHLTSEEISRFVSFETLGDDNIALAAKVNSHILKCDLCLSLVREAQKRYDSEVCEDNEPDAALWSSETEDEPALKTF